MERKDGIESAGEKCAHHFVIEPPNGPTSNGYCKKCGSNKMFPNDMLIASDTVRNPLKPNIVDQRREHKRRTTYLIMESELPPPDLD